MTERLYLDDPLLFAFEASVIGHARWKDAPSLVLDRSAFYPESGGQMADRGTLGDRPVIDVQLDEAGIVHHLLARDVANDPPPIGARVSCTIDAVRRRGHMALHTGQHLLSRALLEIANAETISSRLGESACTIDLDRDALPDARLAEAESIVHAWIDEDRPVRAWFPSDEELAGLSLRRPPKAEHARIRVVDAGGFDLSPCGGTHVLHTSQIELVRVIGSERYKGGTRVTFSAGPRARRDLLAESTALREIARALSCAPAEALAQLGRLREALDATRQDLGKVRAALARAIASRAFGPVTWIDEGGLDLVRQVATELTREGERLAVVAGPVESGVHVIVARAPSCIQDAREVLARITKACGGRGGGRPERAEARLPPIDGATLAALVSAIAPS